MKTEQVPKVLRSLGIEFVEDGVNLLARCPSGRHPDRNPSFYVSVADRKAGLHVCRSCGFGGDMIDLVMHVQGVGYRDAATWLRRINEGEEERPPAPPIKLDYLPLVDRGFKLPAEVDFLPIDKWPTLARRYAEERGFAGQVKRWRIGVAVDGRLAGRIAFVTQRRGGTPTNYSARTFINDPVRYLSAPEECNPDPRVLFGEHRWSNINDRIFLCEGAINALAVERAFMFDDVAAMHGSNVLPVYSLKLSRYKTVVCMTDPDPAGEKAASILQRSLLSHVQFIRVKLPIGHDAASIPPEELQAAVAASL